MTEPLQSNQLRKISDGIQQSIIQIEYGCYVKIVVVHLGLKKNMLTKTLQGIQYDVIVGICFPDILYRQLSSLKKLHLILAHQTHLVGMKF